MVASLSPPEVDISTLEVQRHPYAVEGRIFALDHRISSIDSDHRVSAWADAGLGTVAVCSSHYR